jgi:hypothetical protein
MMKSKSTEAHRRLLIAGGAGLLGIASFAMGWMAQAAKGGGRRVRAGGLAGRIRLPRGTDSMMQAFARDPEKVERFRELTRWRKLRDEELRNV